MSSLPLWPAGNLDRATSTRGLSSSRNKSFPLSISEDVWRKEEEQTEQRKREEKSYSRKGFIFFYKNVIRDTV